MLTNLANFIAGQEWIFIIIIAAVFIFGAKKIPELAKTFGKAKGEYTVSYTHLTLPTKA